MTEQRGSAANEPRVATPTDQRGPAPNEQHVSTPNEPRVSTPNDQRGSTEPVQERARRTRRAVLLAAAEAFAEHGYLATTTSDIAARAGVTKGALAFHFPAKAQVAAAIVEECYEWWPSVVTDVSPLFEHVVDVIGEVLARVAVQIREDPIVRATVRLQAERSLIAEPVRMPYVDWIAVFTDLFVDSAQRGELRPGLDPAELAWMTVASLQGVHHVSGMLCGYADISERVAQWWAVFRHGLETTGFSPQSSVHKP